ncbi:MAG TPA: Hpt domain-containing protein [Gemmatimonadaceae bacterium]|nr:Hpt domain-containing protein [Gemmatimonadaceae bacterium]
MTADLLDFFLLEAGECVERIDFLLARAGSAAPDFAAVARNARVLRGSATMAKVPGITAVASGLERVVLGLREGTLAWNESLQGAVTAAVDDLKVLLHGVRSWGSEQARRAERCARELNALAPAFRRRSSLTPITASGNARFLADETASVAAGLQRFADSPSQITVFEETLSRVRALRGVASLNDLPPLAEVIAAVDDAAKPIELGAGLPTDTQRELFRCAAAVLREGSDAVHNGGRPDVDSRAVEAFTAAAAKFIDGAVDTEYVVPVSALFPDDGGVNAIHTAPNPPTQASQRFRLEVVSQAEHVRRLVSDARRAVDPPARQRIGHELRTAVRSLWRAAESFDQGAVARTLHSLVEGAATLGEDTLTAVDTAAEILTAPGHALVSAKFEVLSTPARAATPVATPRIHPLASTPRGVAPRGTPPAATPPAVAAPNPETPVAPAAPPKQAMPATPPTPAAPITAAPHSATSGAVLQDLLGAGIAGLAGLNSEPMSQPVNLDDESVVPIEDLVYNRPGALRRALELGSAFKRSAKQASPESLAELYDLLELAARK